MWTLKCLVGAFYSAKVYREFAKASKLRLLAAVALLTFFVVVMVSFRVAYNFNFMLGANAHAVVRQLPAMTIKNGELKTPKPQAYHIYSPNQQSLWVLIDTTQALSPARAAEFVTMDKKHVRYFSWHGYVTMPYPFKNQVLSHDFLLQYALHFTYRYALIAGALFFVIAYFFLFAFLTVFPWVMSSLVQSLARQFDMEIKWSQSRNLAFLSLTPFFIILALSYLLAWFRIEIVLLLIAALGFYTVFSVYALKSSKGEAQ